MCPVWGHLPWAINRNSRLSEKNEFFLTLFWGRKSGEKLNSFDPDYSVFFAIKIGSKNLRRLMSMSGHVMQMISSRPFHGDTPSGVNGRPFNHGKKPLKPCCIGVFSGFYVGDHTLVRAKMLVECVYMTSETLV